jgi:hypothetical protein
MATTYYAREVNTEHYRCGLSLVTRDVNDPLVMVFVAGDRTFFLCPPPRQRQPKQISPNESVCYKNAQSVLLV